MKLGERRGEGRENSGPEHLTLSIDQRGWFVRGPIKGHSRATQGPLKGHSRATQGPLVKIGVLHGPRSQDQGFIEV